MARRFAIGSLVVGVGCAAAAVEPPTATLVEANVAPPVEPEEPEELAVVDFDGDGIADADDECPHDSEDFDGDKDEDGCPDMAARLDPCAIKLLEPVYFAYDKWEIDKRSFALLNDVTTILFREPTVTIFISGHTDSKGRDEYNQQLSERRAKHVMQYLVDHGISPQRMKGTGFGEKIPVDTNRTEEGRANNRRVEIRRTDVPGCH